MTPAICCPSASPPCGSSPSASCSRAMPSCAPRCSRRWDTGCSAFWFPRCASWQSCCLWASCSPGLSACPPSGGPSPLRSCSRWPCPRYSCAGSTCGRSSLWPPAAPTPSHNISPQKRASARLWAVFSFQQTGQLAKGPTRPDFAHISLELPGAAVLY